MRASAEDGTPMSPETCDIHTKAYLPDTPWALPTEETRAPFEAGHDSAPDFIYARGVPATPNLDQTSINTKRCTLILLEIGFRRDFNCDDKHTKKIEKNPPLIAALHKLWGREKFVAIPMGHAGTTLRWALRPPQHRLFHNPLTREISQG
jgi:hypothetical protein